jgi:hypothetical protein
VAELLRGSTGLHPPYHCEKIEEVIKTVRNLCVGLLIAPLLAHKFTFPWKKSELIEMIINIYTGP